MNIEDSINQLHGLAPTEETRSRWLYVFCYDGAFVPVETKVSGIDNSFVTQGLGFRVVVSLKGNVPYLWKKQCRIMEQCMELLMLQEYDFPQWDVLYRRIEILAAKNHYPGHSQMYLTVWLENNQLHFTIQQCRIEGSIFDTRHEPIFLYEYADEQMPTSPYNCIPRPSLMHSMAMRQLHLRDDLKEFAGAVFLNSDGKIVQSTIGNLYILIGNTIITPKPQSGSYLDALTETVEIVASQVGLSFQYSDGFTQEDISKATECMVASNAYGLYLVRGMGMARFLPNRLAKVIVEINKRLV